MSDNELIAKSTTVYHQRCVRNGLIFNQPDKGLSELDDDIVVLRNCNGVLAKYRWTYKGLRFVKGSDSEDQTNE